MEMELSDWEPRGSAGSCSGSHGPLPLGVKGTGSCGTLICGRHPTGRCRGTHGRVRMGQRGFALRVHLESDLEKKSGYSFRDPQDHLQGQLFTKWTHRTQKSYHTHGYSLLQ